MNRLNRKVEYALLALKHMGEKFAGQLTSAKEICETSGAPFDATARVMQLMAHKGLLKSEHGAQGGYMVVRDLSRVSFQELLEMILGPVEIVKCLQSETGCELVGNCQIRSPVQILNQKLLEFYSGITLAEILQLPESRTTANENKNRAQA